MWSRYFRLFEHEIVAFSDKPRLQAELTESILIVMVRTDSEILWAHKSVNQVVS